MHADLHCYTVRVGAITYPTWATSAGAAVCEAIARYGAMGVSARRAG